MTTETHEILVACATAGPNTMRYVRGVAATLRHGEAWCARVGLAKAVVDTAYHFIGPHLLEMSRMMDEN